MRRATRELRDTLIGLYCLSGSEPIRDMLSHEQLETFKTIRVKRWNRYRGKYKQGEYKHPYGAYVKDARIYYEIQLVAEILCDTA